MTPAVDHYWTPAVLVNHSEIMVLDIISTSNHMECEPTAMRNICPINRPANSTCVHCHGAIGQVHGCVRTCGGVVCTEEHALQVLTSCTIPECDKRDSSKTGCHSLSGTITRIPHNKPFSSTVNSLLHTK